MLIATLTFSSLLILAGCQNGASFEQAPGSNYLSLDADPTVPLPGTGDSATQQVATLCEQAEAKGTLLNQTEILTFADPGKACAWGVDGNLSPRDQWHQARTEQKLNVQLPAGATLCHMKFDFKSQPFRFDDHFWFTFDDVILASSIDYSDRFGVTNGLSLFDWSKIVGTRWDTSREGVWCMAGAACSWPKTDTDGKINMDFRDGSYYAVSARDRARTQHSFSFVTVGDNDSTDCQHLPVTTTVTLQYVK
jgi:hypothetical protein